MTKLLEHTIARLRALASLPKREQDRIATRILKQLDEVQTEAFPDKSRLKKRTPGLGKGTVIVAEDFDAPLPDAFWLGNE